MAPFRSIVCSGCALAFAMMAVAEATAASAAKPILALNLYLGSCRVDTSLINCAREQYPVAFMITILGIFAAVGAVFALWNREP